jgi:site-specific recombinase XerD
LSKIKYFSTEEINAFFKVLKKGRNIRDNLFFHFIYRYGLRLNEALQIKLDDVSPVEIEIRRLKGGQGRHYPIAIDDSKILSRWLKTRSRLKNSNYNSYLFITSRSAADHMSEAMGKKLHSKYCDLAGIDEEKRNNIHAWRHSCAISLLLSGKDIYYVKTWLGHKSVSFYLNSDHS